jgi:hypothetical protein
VNRNPNWNGKATHENRGLREGIVGNAIARKHHQLGGAVGFAEA